MARLFYTHLFFRYSPAPPPAILTRNHTKTFIHLFSALLTGYA